MYNGWREYFNETIHLQKIHLKFKTQGLPVLNEL